MIVRGNVNDGAETVAATVAATVARVIHVFHKQLLIN